MSLKEKTMQYELDCKDHDNNVELVVQSLVIDAFTQLRDLWQTCQSTVRTWRNEVDHAKGRVTELEKEVQTIKAQFQGNKSTGWCIQSLDKLCSGTLRDRAAALEMELKFLESVRTSRLTEIDKLRNQLRLMDKKLGTTSTLPAGISKLSEEFKVALQDLVKSRSREVHTRRAALLEAVSECVQLARELQIGAENTFEAEINARLKERDLSTRMLQKISRRTVELREMKVRQEACLADMLGQIRDLWQELKISDEEQERFQMTIHGVGKAALASCEAELTRLQRHHKRFSATAVQVANLRNTITEYWDLLGYDPDQRIPFTAMMTTPDTELSYRIFRAHEKEAERLKRHVSAMKFLTHYVVKREEILQARAEHGVPDERTRLHIERELPRYTAMLLNRIAKWEKETGVVFRWNGEPYLEHMRMEDHKFEKQRNKIKQAQPQQAQNSSLSSGGPNNRRRRLQTNRHSIQDCAPPTHF
ncbi:unnamed protein product [Peronospora farinosa]|uniref:Uncharacterized protein n=1 Tax=Peronospora farinosa TaxID=134698 RepID=A0ABN8CH81_9STRA|nr:unnamed protein product [Peronospora farinosa]